MMIVRPPAVAGAFYPANEEQLREWVTGFLETAVPIPASLPLPKAIIGPHAGYNYSGPIAGTAYAPVMALRGQVERVILLGPAHTMALRGLATTSADAFRTPLGDVPIDHEALQKVRPLLQVQVLDAAHEREHGLEVHLPFLQMTLAEFTLAPFVVGAAKPGEVAAVIKTLWGGPETLVVISSDLSHFLDYESARQLDRAAAQAIEQLRPDALAPEQACGRRPIQGLLLVARAEKLSATTLDLRNSGDTAGSRDRVVGYGAWLLG